MRILISNDDGIDSLGIKALVDILKDEHEIDIAAPANQQSAKSHSFTLNGDLMVEKIEYPGARSAYAIDATPADCVYCAVNELLPQRPDVIISGINHGFNLSTDCLYSGTIGAASEGLVLGIPALAVSLVTLTSYDFTAPAIAAKQLLPILMKDPDNLKYLLSINSPDIPVDQIKGYRVVGFDGHRTYHRKYTITKISETKSIHHIKCDIIKTLDKDPNILGDVSAVEQGYISVTPVSLDWVDHQKEQQLKSLDQLSFEH